MKNAMPHLILEYSANHAWNFQPQPTLRALHEALAGVPSVALDDIKSRAVKLDTFRVADGAPARGFVHLRVELLAGRDEPTKKLAAERLLAVLQANFRPSIEATPIDFSIEIRDMDRASYWKHRAP